MYIPRGALGELYRNLIKRTHPHSAPVLILCALDPDAVAGCRILTHLLKHDYIPHKIQPISGFSDLERAGRDNVRPMLESQGGPGGVVVCLGVGARSDLGSLLGISAEIEGEGAFSGVSVWVVDAQRPWHLENVFGGAARDGSWDDGSPGPIIKMKGVEQGRITRGFTEGTGGIIVWDDGGIEEELEKERQSYFQLDSMPPLDHVRPEDLESDSEGEDEERGKLGFGGAREKPGQKRKSWSDREEGDSEDDISHPPQRRRSNSSSPIPELSSRRPARRGLMQQDNPDAIIHSDQHSRSLSPTPGQAPPPKSVRAQTRELLQLRQKHETVLDSYYSLGASYSEPIASMMYSLCSDLGRECNDYLWLAIVGSSSLELSGRSTQGLSVTSRHSTDPKYGQQVSSRIATSRRIMREEVRRLNPPDKDGKYEQNSSSGLIPTTAKSPTDTSIRLSPEPKFLLIRHWSLYDSMLHSPYLSSRLHVWTDSGRKRLHKMLAKMGVSLVQCKQSYTHMDMEVKKGLRGKLIKYKEMYDLPELVPDTETDGPGGDKAGWGFVRSWGWSATLSAQDVGVIVGSILEVGKGTSITTSIDSNSWDRGHETKEATDKEGIEESQEFVARFWDAYDALSNINTLLASLPLALHLHRAILRTGTSIITKKQIKHLSTFRLCILKDGPDLGLFCHPSALTKLALWLGEAFAEQDWRKDGKLGQGGRGTPLVVAVYNEKRGCFTVVGTGGGGGAEDWGRSSEAKERKEKREMKRKEKEAEKRLKQKAKDLRREARQLEKLNRCHPDDEEEDDTETESEESESEEESEDEQDVEEKKRSRGFGRNKFGVAFQEVVEETEAAVRTESFESCVVEVGKESLAVFLEGLSLKNVVG